MMEFQVPKIVHEEVDEQRGVFVIEPLDRGFGYTFGNSLRRVLLSSLEGAAVTSVKIEGVAHEFTTLPGVREDVTDIILNLKNLICRLHGESPEVEVRLQKKGPGAVKAGDIQAPAELEILNPELEIANLADKGKLELTLTIGRGRGYVPGELNRGPEHTIGVIPIDSMFSPVRRVSYDVEAARVGQRTDYDKLRLDITTDGSLDPREAIGQAAEILIRQLAIFTDIEKIEGFGEAAAAADGGAAGRAVARARDGELPDRGARARRPLVQLPEARRHRDDRRPRDEVRERAGRDPELRQEVDRGGQGDAGHARPAAPRRRRQAAEAPRSEAPPRRQEARPRRLAPQGALLEPRRRADRARPDQDDRDEGEGRPADRRADDHARPARRPPRAPAGDRLPALAGRRAQAVRRGRAALQGPARAATRGSSASARGRATPPRWRTSSSSTSPRRSRPRRRRSAAVSGCAAASRPRTPSRPSGQKSRKSRPKSRPAPSAGQLSCKSACLITTRLVGSSVSSWPSLPIFSTTSIPPVTLPRSA